MPLLRPRRLAAFGLVSSLFATSLAVNTAHSCTRAMFTADDHIVMTARSMDWAEYAGDQLWVFPRGVERIAGTGDNAFSWTAEHGSVAAGFYGKITADGINEKGLVANILYLAESDYGELEGKPAMSIAMWMQYVLDSFASVDEAVTALEQEPFRIVAPTLPDGSAASGHLSVSDASGDSAIFEYLDGQLHIHHGKQYDVMTNSPPYDQQLAINHYWDDIGTQNLVPGSPRAADRFVRTKFFLDSLPTTLDSNYAAALKSDTPLVQQSVAGMISLIRAASVPFGVSIEDKPNIASTLWRTVSDQKNLVYYYESAVMPNLVWLDLKQLDFAASQPKLTINLEEHQQIEGPVNHLLVESDGVDWLLQ